MKSKAFSWILRVTTILVLAFGTGAGAQAPAPTFFRGIINDYTAATGVGGPWEMHGSWSLNLKKDSKADFSAVMTMEHPDSWIAANPGAAPNPNVDNPLIRNPHTHHLTMTDATVSFDDIGVCPVDSPATTVRLVLTGPVSITGNGNPAPFETKGPSTLHVCITGGSEVPYSNIALTFTSTSPATGHFGTQSIHGVVRFAHKEDDHHEEPRDDHHDGRH